MNFIYGDRSIFVVICFLVRVGALLSRAFFLLLCLNIATWFRQDGRSLAEQQWGEWENSTKRKMICLPSWTPSPPPLCAPVCCFSSWNLKSERAPKCFAKGVADSSVLLFICQRQSIRSVHHFYHVWDTPYVCRFSPLIPSNPVFPPSSGSFAWVRFSSLFLGVFFCTGKGISSAKE